MLQRFVALCFMLLAAGVRTANAQAYDVIQERNGLTNAFVKLKTGKAFTAVYLGGASTYDKSKSAPTVSTWRSLTTDWLRRQYPRSAITVFDLSSAYPSGAQACWLHLDEVISLAPDLVFLDFAVDELSGSPDEVEHVVEGLLRRIRLKLPSTEVCFFYGPHKSTQARLGAGFLPPMELRLDTVAAHYSMPSVSGSVGLSASLLAGGSWDAYMSDDAYPKAAGHKLFADVITSFYAQQALHASRPVIAYRLAPPLSRQSWDASRFIDQYSQDLVPHGWVRSTGPTHYLECNDTPHAQPVTVTATGGAFAVQLVEPVPSKIRVRIDHGDWKTVACGERIWDMAPQRNVVLATKMSDAEHTLEILPSESSNEPPLMLVGWLFGGGQAKPGRP